MAVLTAEALRKHGHLTEARQMVDLAGSFWSTTWRKWLAVTLQATETEKDLVAPLP
jgi:hypothetical protein